MQNGIVLTPEQQLALIEQYGGLEAWGTELIAPHYAAAWAWAGNCPFQWGKQVASHLGGTRQPMVVRYPRLITEPGGLRSQFTHCIDIGPTILELAGLPQPTHVDGIAQEPMHGTSFLHTLADPGAGERHTQQYFEIAGYRAMYKDGWWLAQSIPRIPWDATPATMKKFAPGVWQPDDDPAELYYLPDDFTQADNMAAEHPEKVAELRELFWAEAEKYKVLPLLGGLSFYFGLIPPLARADDLHLLRRRAEHRLRHDPPDLQPLLRDHRRPGDPPGGAEGVIVAEADHLGGFSLFVEGGKLRHTYSMMGVQVYRQESDTPLPAGEVTVRLEFHADAAQPATGGDIRLFANGQEIGKGRMDRTVPLRFSGYAGMDIGRDNGGVVDRDYANRAPFAFTGTVKKVIFDIKPHLTSEDEQALHESAHHGHVAHGISG